MCQQLIAADMIFFFFRLCNFSIFRLKFFTIKIVIPLKMCPFSLFCVSERPERGFSDTLISQFSVDAGEEKNSQK